MTLEKGDVDITKFQHEIDDGITDSVTEVFDLSELEELEGEAEPINAPPKDKGYAWVVAVAGLLGQLCTWGCFSLYGVFLLYYLSNNPENVLPYNYTLIAGLIFFSCAVLAPVSLIAYRRFGFRWVAAGAVVGQTGGYLMALWSTKLWQLYLTQGVLVGALAVFIYIPITSIVPTWFEKYLATGQGITGAGIGTGGIIFSLTINVMIEKYGVGWALRMVGMVSGFAGALAALILRERVPTKRVPLKQDIKEVFDFRVFNLVPMYALLAWYCTGFIGSNMLLNTLPTYGIDQGLLPKQALILSATINAAQLIGRPLIGVLADHLGRVNFSIFLNGYLTIVMCVMWPLSHLFGVLLGFAILIGLGFGAMLTMMPLLMLETTGDRRVLVPGWAGCNMASSIFQLTTPTAAMGIRNATHSFIVSQEIGGVSFGIGFLGLLIVRWYIIKRKNLSMWLKI